MERFKACEKEMKTKAFSKEGLSAGHRLDPKEQQKMETTSFISGQVDELSRQVEATEAEIEQLQGGTKKSKKGAASNADRVATLEGQNDRRNWHVSRLELINRLIENGNLDPERVQGLKEDITYFVDSNTVSHSFASRQHFPVHPYLLGMANRLIYPTTGRGLRGRRGDI